MLHGLLRHGDPCPMPKSMHHAATGTPPSAGPFAAAFAINDGRFLLRFPVRGWPRTSISARPSSPLPDYRPCRRQPIQRPQRPAPGLASPPDLTTGWWPARPVPSADPPAAAWRAHVKGCGEVRRRGAATEPVAREQHRTLGRGAVIWPCMIQRCQPSLRQFGMTGDDAAFSSQSAASAGEGGTPACLPCRHRPTRNCASTYRPAWRSFAILRESRGHHPRARSGAPPASVRTRLAARPCKP